MPSTRYMSAEDAAETLGVTKNTLYAYVSRGLIRSEPDEGRRSRYVAQDVEALIRRRSRPSSRSSAEPAPLTSRLTLVEDGHVYYRGHDACRLARSHSIEEVAALMWDGGSAPDDLETPPDVALMGPLLGGLSPVARMQSLLPIVEADDPRAFDLSPEGARHTGWHLLHALACAIDPDSDVDASGDLVHRLCRAWSLSTPAAYRVLQAALVVCVDHEPDAMTGAVRSAAASGASPYGAVLAGLAALRGRRHAGTPARVAALLREAGTADRFRATVAERLQRGDAVPGFGHSAYPDGDPRAHALHTLLRSHFPRAEGTQFAQAAGTVGPELLGQTPSIDFALVAVSHTLDLPASAPLTLVALARSVGWIAHAIEQYDDDTSMRPTLDYTGPRPR